MERARQLVGDAAGARAVGSPCEARVGDCQEEPQGYVTPVLTVRHSAADVMDHRDVALARRLSSPVPRQMSRIVRVVQSGAPGVDACDPRWSTTRSGRRSRLLLVALSALLVAACRGDSLTTPLQQACGDEPGCRTSQRVPVDPAVIAAVDDARERLVPTLDDAAARASLAGALQALQEKLQANNSAESRVRLALVFLELDRLRIAVPGEEPLDLPDMSAIRLALVPVANALGIRMAS